ncbi:hypothetical protein CC78DRAFT_573260 [Lojkania enalia]|uniref:Uncharacterized protein n=1 Tax=Lojkania enalia TaxID=147567 RepID=A0A9P4ND18_9PLEO|nr:hypothetical protein CC78DRAFT_573260 [Didymosphaeria enalia]
MSSPLRQLRAQSYSCSALHSTKSLTTVIEIEFWGDDDGHAKGPWMQIRRINQTGQWFWTGCVHRRVRRTLDRRNLLGRSRIHAAARGKSETVLTCGAGPYNGKPKLMLGTQLDFALAFRRVAFETRRDVARQSMVPMTGCWKGMMYEGRKGPVVSFFSPSTPSEVVPGSA